MRCCSASRVKTVHSMSPLRNLLPADGDLGKREDAPQALSATPAQAEQNRQSPKAARPIPCRKTNRPHRPEQIERLRRQSPDRETKEPRPWGWHYYRRVRSGKVFWRPMNQTVRLHLKSLRPKQPDPDGPGFHGGIARTTGFVSSASWPASLRSRVLRAAGVAPKRSIESGKESPSVLKDRRKACAIHCDEHVPESSVEILGHSAGGITYRHYAHRASLAFRVILSPPQPSAFTALARSSKDQCPCCRRTFLEARA